MSQGLTLDKALELTKEWRDPYPAPIIHRLSGFDIVDESEIQHGSKARFADFYVSRIASDEIVYVAPRFGWAGISLAHVAKRYDKRLTLFMPACKRVSEHQLVAIEAGARPIFYRIAAMPNLNKIASDYAKSTNAEFVPLGLKHSEIVATIARVAHDMQIQPTEVWTAVSTGVLTRGLQLAWPEAKFYGVAVARNLQKGELGRANFLSYDLPFVRNARTQPPFDCAPNYDAKAWELMLEHGAEDALFWSVAGDTHPVSLTPEMIDSNREWGEPAR